jgi:arylsulfatase A-like enzyme
MGRRFQGVMFRILLASLSLLATPLVAGLAGARPNLVFILTDDQGYGDLSAHGNPVLKTPNLDRLRSESLRFTDFVVSPTCAPTRSALMTGRHEFRNGVTHTILERERLDPKAVTVAQVLKSAGYTTGLFGKWHLGDEEAFRPRARGFDEQYIHGGGGIGQSYPGSCGDVPGNGYFDPVILHNDRLVKTQGYCTDVFFEQATRWIGEVRERGPFLCWLATNAPHAPYIARPEDRALYEGRGLGVDTENFFGMIHNIDANVGRLLARLESWGIADNTLVVFMNDNGGTAGVRVFNAGMRGAKGTPWRGGTRAMSFWRWPGRLQPGDCGALVAHIDVFRTWAALAGAELPEAAERQAEGRNLLPLLENPGAEWPDRHLFSHVGRWPKGSDYRVARERNASVRSSRYQLVYAVQDRPAKAMGWQLFDLVEDPAQERDLAAERPEVVQELRQAYDAWWESLAGQADLHEQARGPSLNPFAELYWQQFGGGPTDADRERMNPDRAWTFEAERRRKK